MSEQARAGGSPLTFHEIQTESTEKKYRYRPLKGLTYAVLAFGALHCLTALVVVVSLLHQWQLLARMGANFFPSREVMLAAANASDRAARAAAAVFEIFLLLTYISGGMWIYRANSNVRARGAKRLESSPGWAVGWYFVPYMSLFKPFGAMVEIWNASISSDRWRSRPTPGLLHAWWALWLIANMFGYLVAVMTRGSRSLAGLIVQTRLGIASMVIDTIAAAVFLTVVWRITQLQANAPAAASQTADLFS